MHSNEINSKNFKTWGSKFPLIEKITNPLRQHIPIKHFTYTEIYEDGSYYLIGHNEDEVDLILENECLELFTGTLLKGATVEGFHLSIPRNQSASDNRWPLVISKISEYRELGNLVFYTEKKRDGNKNVLIRLVMAGNKKDDFISFVMNNPTLIKTFLKYFAKEVNHLKGYLPPLLPMKDEKKIYKEFFNNKMNSMVVPYPAFLKEMNQFASLTKKEWEVIEWYLKGKTSEETAMILGRSLNTIEAHFYNIKKKLQVSKKAQIIPTLIDSGDGLFDKLS